MADARVGEVQKRVANVLSNRSDSILLVLENCTDNINYLACQRTADILGVQNLWIVEAPLPVQKNSQTSAQASADAPPKSGAANTSRKKARIARQSAKWLDVRTFATTRECIAALREDSWTIWATYLGDGAEPLDATGALQVPDRVAIVMGREADGVSQLMLESCDRKVYLPMYGFTDSLNLSVATGVVLQQLFHMRPAARGDLSDERHAQLQRRWYEQLARNEAELQLLLQGAEGTGAVATQHTELAAE